MEEQIKKLKSKIEFWEERKNNIQNEINELRVELAALAIITFDNEEVKNAMK